MSGDSVRAILEGRKTQTRRVIKPQPKPDDDPRSRYTWYQRRKDLAWNQFTHEKFLNRCPYGKPGDRLWVREPFWIDERDKTLVVLLDGQAKTMCGDGEGWTDVGPLSINRFWYKKSPLFMPRWAARYFLEITNIRVERVQDINEEDAIAEGISSEYVPLSPPQRGRFEYIAPGVRMVNCYGEVDYHAPAHNTARDAYECLWDSINAKREFSWESNPWVWVIEFKRLENG